MADSVVLLSVPGLRAADLAAMRNLRAMAERGSQTTLIPSFPCVTWPAQANMLTGCLPREHGVVANGFYWRDRQEVEMWTATNDKIERPQLWDLLHRLDPALTSAAWFPMLSKGCGADYICMPAPVHHPDGSESLWCYSRPADLYADLVEAYGPFPLQNFWGPLADINSTAWIANSAGYAASWFHPRFFFIYLPHLDYAAQKFGPDSPQAVAATSLLDVLLGRLIESINEAYVLEPADRAPLWLVASEYAIVPVRHASYPNRLLRASGLLEVCPEIDGGGGELIDFRRSRAWALADHQFSHVFVRDSHAGTIAEVVRLFAGREGFAEVLAGAERARYGIDHARSGDVVLISSAESWQAYYYWLDEARAPSFARTVDIHRKPGYDPVELFFDPKTRGIPLDATLVRGSHGAPATTSAQQGVLVASEPVLTPAGPLRDIDVAGLVLRQF